MAAAERAKPGLLQAIRPDRRAGAGGPRRNAPELRSHWLAVQAALATQRSLSPRGPWVDRLIQELDQRLRLQSTLERWQPNPCRFRLLARLRNLLALEPLNTGLQTAGLDLLRTLNADCLDALEHHLASAAPGLVVVVTGCRRRADRLRRTMRAFGDASGTTAVIGVVGDPRLRDWELRFSRQDAVLRLPISDAYEALPQKIAWSVLALGLCRRPLAMLKVDDDALPADLDAALVLLERLQAQNLAAAGYPITTPSPLSLDRGWHIGKSSPRANRNAFASLAIKNWMSGGVGYLLGPQAVAIISEYALHSWGFFESMLYEDISISMILDAAEARILWLHQADQLGISTERASEIDKGLWPYDASKLD